MDETLRHLVATGLDLVAALATMTTAPAAVLARPDGVGALAVGGPADVVVLDDALAVVDVLVDGCAVT